MAVALSSLKHLDPDTIFPPGSFCNLEEGNLFTAYVYFDEVICCFTQLMHLVLFQSFCREDWHKIKSLRKGNGEPF